VEPKKIAREMCANGLGVGGMKSENLAIRFDDSDDLTILDHCVVVLSLHYYYWGLSNTTGNHLRAYEIGPSSEATGELIDSPLTLFTMEIQIA